MYSEVFPHLIAATGECALVKIDDVDFDNIDAAFCCLPHATTQKIIASLPSSVKVVDLSADFRLRDIGAYKEWSVVLLSSSEFANYPYENLTAWEGQIPNIQVHECSF